jgi:hypothetical protein
MTTTISMAAMMVERSRSGRMELPRDATLRLRAGAHGVRIRAESGTVLVTREGDVDDHLLERGDELLVTGSGLVVAWALVPSSVVLSRDFDGRTPALAGRSAAA